MSRKEPTVNDAIRVGRISAVYPERCTATVLFPDRDGLVSKELSIGQRNTLKNNDECLYDPGEHVLCAFYGNGLSEGAVLCSIYDANNLPMVGDKDRRLVVFEDGAHIFHDRKNHIFQIMDYYGSFILFKDGDIVQQSARHVHLNPHDIPAENVKGPAHLAAQFD